MSKTIKSLTKLYFPYSFKTTNLQVFLIRFIFMYMSTLPASMFVHHKHAQYLWISWNWNYRYL